jgi:DNA-binding IclR family transcriptional regulator
MAKKDKQDYRIQAVDHAISILEAFLGDEEEYGVTELSKKLNLPKNNIFRLLATLEQRGLIEQNRSSGNYRLGLKIFEIGQVYRSRIGLLKHARPILEDLEAKCNETVYLGIMQEGMVVYVDMVETSCPVRIVSKMGRRVPAYCTAIGKAQLAYETIDELELIFEKVGFTHRAKNTIQDKETLLKELKEVVRLGYAVDNEEYEEGVVCVGAPVFDYTKQVVAGICISAPKPRMTSMRIEIELSSLVIEAGKEISRRLGYDVKSI